MVDVAYYIFHLFSKNEIENSKYYHLKLSLQTRMSFKLIITHDDDIPTFTFEIKLNGVTATIMFGDDESNTKENWIKMVNAVTKKRSIQ